MMYDMKRALRNVSSKDQVVIPAALREEMGLVPGTRVAVERQGDTIVLRPVTRAVIRSLRGSFRGMGWRSCTTGNIATTNAS